MKLVDAKQVIKQANADQAKGIPTKGAASILSVILKSGNKVAILKDEAQGCFYTVCGDYQGSVMVASVLTHNTQDCQLLGHIACSKMENFEPADFAKYVALQIAKMSPLDVVMLNQGLTEKIGSLSFQVVQRKATHKMAI